MANRDKGLRGDAWHAKHKFPCECQFCHKKAEKSTMPALYIRKSSDDSMRVLCRMCSDCMDALLGGLKLKMPE